MSRVVAVLAVALAAVIMVSAAQAAQWDVVHREDNLTVARRDFAGSPLNEIEGVLRLRASLNAIMALLKDAPFNEHWVFRSGGARILREDGYGQAWVYGVVRAPFPMSDRDTVVRFDYRQDPRTKVITIDITNVPDFIPRKPGLTRVPGMGGYWRLNPEADGWVEVTYRIHGDPGGWIPAWLANQAAVLSVKHTLRNMVWAVGHYADARSEFVLEPAPAVASAGETLHVPDDGDEVAD